MYTLRDFETSTPGPSFDADLNTKANSKIKTDPNTNTNTNIDAGLHTNTNIDADPGTNTNIKADPNTNTNIAVDSKQPNTLKLYENKNKIKTTFDVVIMWSGVMFSQQLTLHNIRKLGLKLFIVLLSSILIWLALALTVLNRLTIPLPNNGIHRIVSSWRDAPDSSKLLLDWPEDFSRDINPVRCHSHNDYLRQIPLYSALLAGCTSVEADIWLQNASDPSSQLLVGHTMQSLRPTWDLESLYIKPLEMILTQQNANASLLDWYPRGEANVTASPMYAGVFSTAPETTLVLLLDFKMNSDLVWAAVQKQLQPLRDRGWLTHWTNSSGVVEGPITIVASGDALLSQITMNTTYRDIFYDAPLDRLNETISNANSYYASTSFHESIGTASLGRLSSEQKSRIRHQASLASELRLISRYWDTPGWPIGWRNRLWDSLLQLGVGVINTDDVTATSRWDWNMCIVAGIVIC